MSHQFTYVEFSISPKSGLAGQQKGTEIVTVELPYRFVENWKLERPGRNTTDEEIAIDIATPPAIACARKFVRLCHQPLMDREIHSPVFRIERHSHMNERVCDYEDNGIRVWFSN